MPSDKSISLADEREIRRRYGLEKAEKMRQTRKGQADGEGDGFVHGGDGQILKGNPTNIMNAGKHLGIALRLNEFLGQVGVEGMKKYQIFDDAAAIRLRLLIHEKFGFLPTQSVFDQVVSDIAEANSYHPVKDYLNALRWDGQQRLKIWLSYYLGAEQCAYTETIGRAFFLSMVARIYSPGCKQDYMMILEGPQGALKSMACEVIAGEWFSDSLPDVRDSKDLSQHLRGKWLIEVGELSAMSKAETATLKAFITRRTERYRPSYGKREVTQPRQCVFVGTTNDDCYLKDATGGRRFWPVKIGSIDLAALQRDRDQLFAEAVSLFRGGAQWWPDKDFEEAHIRPEQEKRYEEDPWTEAVSEYIKNRDHVTVWDVARYALFVETARVSMRDSYRIGGILKYLKWHVVRSGGVREYRPPYLKKQAKKDSALPNPSYPLRGTGKIL